MRGVAHEFLRHQIRIARVLGGASQLGRNQYPNAAFEPRNQAALGSFVKETAGQCRTQASDLCDISQSEGSLSAIIESTQKEGMPSAYRLFSTSYVLQPLVCLLGD